MHVLAALAVVKEILLEVVADREERAACRVRRGVDAIRARHAAGERGYEGSMSHPHPW